ncbi:MAG: hypothetical protein C0490_03075, partial [Marivirga sp.]|nr:hypothetical protein [Marivirga sp.]
QHAADGVSFVDIDRVKGAGNSSVRLDYESIHYQPAYTKNYYRLKQTDFDGQFSYSQVVFVYADEKSLPTVYPNPATNEWLVDFSGQEIKERVIRLFDGNGSKCLEYKTNGESIVKFKRNNLPAGIYVIQISSPQEDVTSLRIAFN